MSKTAAFFNKNDDKAERSSKKSKTFTKKTSKDSDMPFEFPALTL